MMTMRRWLTILAGSAVTVMVGLCLTIAAVAFDFKSVTQEHNEQISPTVVLASDLHSGIYDLDRGLNTYVRTGNPIYRALYVRADDENRKGLEQISDLRGSDPAIIPSLSEVTIEYGSYLDRVGSPVLALADSGERDKALALLESPASASTFTALLRSSEDLRDAADADNQQSYKETVNVATRLTIALIIAAVSLVAGPLLTWVLVERGVIRPLLLLQKDLRKSAMPGHHENLIEPVGRPEIRAVAEDAERMRRQLVAEIDAAGAARSALEQEGPVVEAIRQELSRRTSEVPGDLVVVGQLRPAEGVLAGDFWDTVKTRDGGLAVVVCDVTGHGAAAGIHALRIKTTLSRGLTEGFTPEYLMAKVADDFALLDGDVFATIAVVIVDPESRTVEWVTAGHPPPRLLSPEGISELSRTGPMVSALGGRWSRSQMDMPAGGVIFMYTDGLLESRDPAGEELGREGIDGLLTRLSAEGRSTEALVGDLIAHGRHRAVNWDKDDITVVALTLPDSPST